MGKTHLGGDWKLPLRKVRGLYRKAKQTRVTIRSEQEGAQKFDALYYRKICQLVSEIASYKKTTFKRVYSAAESRGCKRLSDYYRLLRSSEEERDYLRVNLTLKGTHFFRGEDWGSFAEECLSSFSGRDKVSVWCAGCSSGEEAYSTVMALLDYVPASSIDVLATDYNEELLEKCNKGEYFMMHLKEVPEKYQHNLDIGEKKFAVKPYVREAVHTARQDLIHDDCPTGFDVIVCRNVIKFFDPMVILKVQARLAASLNEGGFLFVSTDDDHASLELIDDPQSLGLVRLEGRPIYQKRAR